MTEQPGPAPHLPEPGTPDECPYCLRELPLFVVSGRVVRDGFRDHVHLCGDCLRTAAGPVVAASGPVRVGEVTLRPPLRWVQVDPGELYERGMSRAPTPSKDEWFQKRVGLQGWILEDADGQVLLEVDTGWGAPDIAGGLPGPVAELLARAGDIPALEERVATLTVELRRRRWPRVFRGELPDGVTGLVLDDDARNGLLADIQDALTESTERETGLREEARSWARLLLRRLRAEHDPGAPVPDIDWSALPAWLADHGRDETDEP